MNAKQRRQAKRKSITRATLEPSQIRIVEDSINSEQTIHPPSPAQVTTRSSVYLGLFAFSLICWAIIFCFAISSAVCAGAVAAPDVAAGPIKLPSPLVAAPVAAPVKIPFIGSVPLEAAETPPVAPPIRAAIINGCIILFLWLLLVICELLP